MSKLLGRLKRKLGTPAKITKTGVSVDVSSAEASTAVSQTENPTNSMLSSDETQTMGIDGDTVPRLGRADSREKDRPVSEAADGKSAASTIETIDEAEVKQQQRSPSPVKSQDKENTEGDGLQISHDSLPASVKAKDKENTERDGLQISNSDSLPASVKAQDKDKAEGDGEANDAAAASSKRHQSKVYIKPASVKASEPQAAAAAAEDTMQHDDKEEVVLELVSEDDQESSAPPAHLHRQVAVIRQHDGEKEEVEVDEGLSSLLPLIWQQGWTTYNSCQDNQRARAVHPEFGPNYPNGVVWIQFELAHGQAFLDMIYKASDQMSRKHMASHSFAQDQAQWQQLWHVTMDQEPEQGSDDEESEPGPKGYGGLNFFMNVRFDASEIPRLVQIMSSLPSYQRKQEQQAVSTPLSTAVAAAAPSPSAPEQPESETGQKAASAVRSRESEKSHYATAAAAAGPAQQSKDLVLASPVKSKDVVLLQPRSGWITHGIMLGIGTSVLGALVLMRLRRQGSLSLPSFNLPIDSSTRK